MGDTVEQDEEVAPGVPAETSGTAARPEAPKAQPLRVSAPQRVKGAVPVGAAGLGHTAGALSPPSRTGQAYKNAVP